MVWSQMHNYSDNTRKRGQHLYKVQDAWSQGVLYTVYMEVPLYTRRTLCCKSLVLINACLV